MLRNRGIATTGGRSAAQKTGLRLGTPQAGQAWRSSPAGRPKGSRNKLSDAFLQALADDFEAHGKWVVERVRTERPQDYLKIVASVCRSEWKSRMLVHRAGLLIYPMTSLQRS